MPEVQRSADRFCTEADGISTRHSFSYGAHYDPDNIGFGLLMAVNEETIAPGHGYELHHHADVEIVTWVIEGELTHEDTAGNSGIISPGFAQRLSAGSGVQHSERNASGTQPLRFLQMMLRSDHDGSPAYEQRPIAPGTGRLLSTVPVLQRKARLLFTRCGNGEMIHVPRSDLAFLQVLRGSVSAAEYLLHAGDALRLADAGAYDVCTTAASGSEPAEVLIWQMQR